MVFHDVNTVTLGYNDLGFCDTSFIRLYVLFFQLIHIRHVFSTLLSTTHITASTSDITTRPVGPEAYPASRTMYQVSFPEVKPPGRGLYPPPPS